MFSPKLSSVSHGALGSWLAQTVPANDQIVQTLSLYLDLLLVDNYCSALDKKNIEYLFL